MLRARHHHLRGEERLRAPARAGAQAARGHRALAHRTPVQLVPTVLAHVVPASFRERPRRVRRRCFCDALLAPAAPARPRALLRRLRRARRFRADEARAHRQAARAGRPRAQAARRPAARRRRRGARRRARALSPPITSSRRATSGAGALAAAGVVATILPGCRLFLGRGPWPTAAPCATPAARWRSPPTATRAPRWSPTSRCARRWRPRAAA